MLIMKKAPIRTLSFFSFSCILAYEGVAFAAYATHPTEHTYGMESTLDEEREGGAGGSAIKVDK